MAESNADTLRQQLETILPVILSDGGSNDRDETEENFRVLKAIDDAITILTSLKKVESKTPESVTTSSSSPSTSVEVPKEFICGISQKIMIEPVTIASGHTFDKRYIADWLVNCRTCPKTFEVLSHTMLTPNHFANEMISQWCRLNKFDRPEPSQDLATELFTHDIESLLDRISSPASVADQTEAAAELHERTKKFVSVRVFFVSQVHDSITRLLAPLSALGEAVNTNPELQEHIIAILFNISTIEKNKTLVAEHPHVIPLLIKSLKQGSDETRRNSAGTLSSLAAIDSNKVIIGNSEVLKDLVGLIKEGDYLSSKEAAAAVFKLYRIGENREKAVSAGLVPVVIDKIKAGSIVDELVAVMAFVSTHREAIEEMDKLEFIKCLCIILRDPCSKLTDENAVVIVYNMCESNRNGVAMKVVSEEEKQHGTFTKLAKQGTDRAMRKAALVLMWIKKFDAGKNPQRT